jgi:hypothetical protein
VRDLQEACRAKGVFLTTIADPTPMPVAVFAGPDEAGHYVQTGLVDVPAISSADSGYVFAKDGSAPVYMALAGRTEVAHAATTYLGVDLSSAFPWRLVVALGSDPLVEQGTTELSHVLSDRDIYLLTWKPGDPRPVAFPSVAAPVGTLDPGAVTSEPTGWIFAEAARPPVYQPSGPLMDVVRALGDYFHLTFELSSFPRSDTTARARPPRQAGTKHRPGGHPVRGRAPR